MWSQTKTVSGNGGNFKTRIAQTKAERRTAKTKYRRPIVNCLGILAGVLKDTAPHISHLFSEGVILGSPQNVDRPNHIGQSWGVHQSTVCRIVHRVEDKLIKSGKFNLPGKKALSSTETEWSVVIVDVGESPIERPKKNSVITTAEKAMQRGLGGQLRASPYSHERLHQERRDTL